MSLEQKFERAKQFEGFRQDFLDKFDMEYAKKFVKRVAYEPKQKLNGNGVDILMVCRPKFIPFLGSILLLPHAKSTIVVYPSAFENHNTKEFQNMLIDHEGYHAIQHFINPWMSGQLKEQEAYWNQITQSSYRGLDDNWRIRLTHGYFQHNG